MNYADHAARVAIGLTVATYAFLTLLQNPPTTQVGVIVLLVLAAGLFVAVQWLFAGVEAASRRARQESGEHAREPTDADRSIDG